MIARCARFTLVLLALVPVLWGALGGARGVAVAEERTDARAPAEHVVFVGVPGLTWDDVDPEVTPVLAGLTGRSATAALSVRTVYPRGCAVDGWLTVGGGARAADVRTSSRSAVECPAPEPPLVDAGGAVTVPGMPAIVAHNKQYGYNPRWGQVAASVLASGGCVTAAGPGAAYATASADGRVQGRYLPDATAVDAGVIGGCGLTIVDGGRLTPGAGEAAGRTALLRAFDTRLGALVAAAPPRTSLLVAGIADDTGGPALRALLATGPGTRPGTVFDSGLLTSVSTRHDGLVQLTDVAPSMLAMLGVDAPSALVGSVVTSAGGPSGMTAVRELRLFDAGAQASRTVREHWLFFTWLGLVPPVLAVLALVLGRRFARQGRQVAWRRLCRSSRILAIGFGAVPGASFLVGLLPWEKAGDPAWALLGLTLAWTVAIAAIALLGPWRRAPYGPAGVVAGITALVLAVDVIAGSPLQLNTLFGLSPLIAGRFYGFGNVAWIVFAMAALLAAAWPAGRLARAGRHRAAAALLAGLGALAVVVDGWPGFGSDFGGVLALVPGFALLALLVTGVRVSWGKAALIAVGAVAVITVIAVLDWLRPAGSRSHLGRFVQEVLDGDAGDTLHRKIMGNLNSFTTPVSYLLPVVLVVLLIVVLDPARLRARGLAETYERVPWFRPVLIACWVTAIVGYAVNDSGIQIPAVALTVAGPLPVAVIAAVLERRRLPGG